MAKKSAKKKPADKLVAVCSACGGDMPVSCEHDVLLIGHCEMCRRQVVRVTEKVELST